MKQGDKVEVSTANGSKFGTFVRLMPNNNTVEVLLDGGYKQVFSEDKVFFIGGLFNQTKKIEDIEAPSQNETKPEVIREAKIKRLTSHALNGMRLYGETDRLLKKIEEMNREIAKIKTDISDIKKIEVKVQSKVRHLLSLKTNLCDEAIIAQVKNTEIPEKFKR